MSCLSFLSRILTIMLPFVWLAKADAGPFAYITNHESWNVSVIDTQTNTVVKTIPIGGWPIAVAVSPAGDRIYVTRDRQSDAIVVIEVNTIVDTFETRARYIAGMAITPDGRQLYIADFSTAIVYVFDAIQGVEISSIHVADADDDERPLGVAVHPAGTYVYITHLLGDRVSVIDTATRTVIHNVELRSGVMPRGIAVSPMGDRVYLAEVSGDVAVIDTVTHGVTLIEDVGTGLNGIAIDPLGTRVYVTNSYDETENCCGDSVTVIDATTNTVIDTIRVGQWPSGINVHPDGSLVYVANSGDDTVSVIDTVMNTVITTIPVGSWPIAWGTFIAPSFDGETPQDFCVVTVDSPAGTFEDLQEAIDAADNGATITVEGVCTGPVEVYRRKNLTIEGFPPGPSGCLDGGPTPVSLMSTVKGSDDAVIRVKKSRNITIRFLNIVDGEDSGIEFDRSEASVATCNSLVSNADEGVKLERGKRNEVRQNLVMRNGDDGIKLYKSDENRVIGNSVFDNSDDGIEVQRSEVNLVNDNDVRGNDEDGIDLDDADGSQVVGNVVVANGSRSKKDSGIEVQKSDGNLLDANTINENADGLVDEIRCQKGSDDNTGSNVTPSCL